MVKIKRDVNRIMDTYHAGCTGKFRYATGQKAMGMATKLFAEQGALRPYYCKCCQGWHLTSLQGFVPEKSVKRMSRGLPNRQQAIEKTQKIRRQAEARAEIRAEKMRQKSISVYFE